MLTYWLVSRRLMFYYSFFDHIKLANYSTGEKHKIIKIAVRQSRQEHPLDITRRLSILSAVVLTPSILIYFSFNANAALIWAILATEFLNIRAMQSQSPAVERYLDGAIQEFNNLKLSTPSKH